LLSLLIGTIAGLSQIKIKRLLAFSSISHVGFLLLALGVYTQKSVDSFIFYLVQYSITSLNIFLILLAFGYLVYSQVWSFTIVNPVFLPSLSNAKGGENSLKKANDSFINKTKSFVLHQARRNNKDFISLWPASHPYSKELKAENDFNFLIELKGQLYRNPVLSISFTICLFSMAGIPPLIGFFSKQFVLFSSIENGNHFLSIVAILVSVISASYYLKLIRITSFSNSNIGPWLKDSLAHSLNFSNASLYLRADTQEIKESGVVFQKKREDNLLNSSDLEGATPLRRQGQIYLSNIHSYIIAILTFLILFFFLDPSILLNGTQLISLTFFNL
jgi:NADH-ubiquinone oxidoreductase chain 2